MKTTLYYFSATGNTLYLARRLADELGDTELISITKAMKEDELNPNTENVGIVFPVYCFGTPNIIKHFITKLKVPESSYFFATVSFGGFLGPALKILRKECQKAGLNLQAGLSVQMPGNAIVAYDRFSEKKVIKLAQMFDKKIPKISGFIKSKNRNNMDTLQPLLHPIMYPLHRRFMNGFPTEDDKYFTTDACKLCGNCIKVCPVDNITIENKKIVWGNKCEQCMACIQWCPSEAIQFSNKTANRKRYHHPKISMKDIMNQ